jgi:hypothetical protein
VIRFIDLRRSDTGHRFAFFDTVTDRFVTICGEQAWADAGDLWQICRMMGVADAYQQRLRRQMPKWAFRASAKKDAESL